MHLRSSLGAIALAVLAAVPARADDDGIGKIRTGVPNAVTPTPGVEQPSRIDPDFAVRLLATAEDPLENPSGVISKFGILTTGVRTEPDQNLYLRFPHNPGGPTPGFNYGRNFLYQGHENAGNLAYVTRINLDVNDPAHRTTLLTPVNSSGGTGFNAIDGSTYNPFTDTFLFTQETSTAGNGTGAVIQITPGWPPVINTLGAFLGLGGYEGIHPDDKGTLYFQEDVGGSSAPAGTLATIDGTPNVPLRAARQPNSFVYRYVPNNPKRLEDGGKLQVVQAIVDGTPVTFHAADLVGDLTSTAQRKLHSPGTSWPIKWVTIHESHAGDTASFVATAAAKTGGGTPFKRPENMAWLPGSDFRTFFFTITGDTDAPTAQIPQLAARGAWGAIFRVDLRDDDRNGHQNGNDKKPAADDGKISLFVLGDQDHNSFDNLAFANERQLLAAEDRGNALHLQLQKFDSVWAYDVKGGQAIRFIALGRDAAAIAQTEDNEPTGVFVSNGSPRKQELLGTDKSLDDARGFFTQQHGDNNVYELINVRKQSGHH